MNRRYNLFAIAILSCVLLHVQSVNAADEISADLRDRIHGLLVGSMIGDALGGPIEFQDAAAVQQLENPPKIWGPNDVIDDSSLAALAGRLKMRSYQELRPAPEPYAHWTVDAPPGTVTDDSRHKLILLQALHYAHEQKSWPITVEAFARAHLDWSAGTAIKDNESFKQLNTEWLREWEQAARWVLGNRDPEIALPPSRMWAGLPTCSGQMSLLPLAALFPGQPESAYRAAYLMGFFDNGFGKDLNAGLVAGLAVALKLPNESIPDPVAWTTILKALRMTDPYDYKDVPWVTRPVDRWLNFALSAARNADGRPARMFETLEREFENTIKWEAQVPFVVAFACLEICNYEPLAALQLSLEWGHDTDSYAQIVGAFIGALHGATVFPPALRQPVESRLKADYQVDLPAEVEFLYRLIANPEIGLLIQVQ